MLESQYIFSMKHVLMPAWKPHYRSFVSARSHVPVERLVDAEDWPNRSNILAIGGEYFDTLSQDPTIEICFPSILPAYTAISCKNFNL